MSGELIAIPTRDDFIKFVNDRLKEIGFIKDSETEHWTLDTNIRTGGGVMVVNGQRMENPGEIYHVVFNVEVVGEGSMKDVDTGVEENFTEMDFYMIESEIRHDLTPTMCMYFDDQNEFNMVLNNMLRM